MKIEEKRNEIDAIDGAIVDLLNQRAMIAKEIGTIKTRAGLPTIDEQRERDVLTRLSQVNAGCIPDESLLRIYRGILGESRRIQSSVRSEMTANGVL